MFEHDGQQSKNSCEQLTFAWETIVIQSSNVVDRWQVTEPSSVDPRREVCPRAALVSANRLYVGCDSNVSGNEQFVPCDSVVAAGSRSFVKKIKPTPNTLAVIRLIERGLSNDRIQQMLPNRTVANIRTIRSRLKQGRYEL